MSILFMFTVIGLACYEQIMGDYHTTTAIAIVHIFYSNRSHTLLPTLPHFDNIL